jgi:hypothetical protein
VPLSVDKSNTKHTRMTGTDHIINRLRYRCEALRVPVDFDAPDLRVTLSLVSIALIRGLSSAMGAATLDNDFGEREE